MRKSQRRAPQKTNLSSPHCPAKRHSKTTLPAVPACIFTCAKTQPAEIYTNYDTARHKKAHGKSLVRPTKIRLGILGTVPAPTRVQRHWYCRTGSELLRAPQPDTRFFPLLHARQQPQRRFVETTSEQRRRKNRAGKHGATLLCFAQPGFESRPHHYHIVYSLYTHLSSPPAFLHAHGKAQMLLLRRFRALSKSSGDAAFPLFSAQNGAISAISPHHIITAAREPAPQATFPYPHPHEKHGVFYRFSLLFAQNRAISAISPRRIITAAHNPARQATFPYLHPHEKHGVFYRFSPAFRAKWHNICYFSAPHYHSSPRTRSPSHFQPTHSYASKCGVLLVYSGFSRKRAAISAQISSAVSLLTASARMRMPAPRFSGLIRATPLLCV